MRPGRYRWVGWSPSLITLNDARADLSSARPACQERVKRYVQRWERQTMDRLPQVASTAAVQSASPISAVHVDAMNTAHAVVVGSRLASIEISRRMKAYFSQSPSSPYSD